MNGFFKGAAGGLFILLLLGGVAIYVAAVWVNDRVNDAVRSAHHFANGHTVVIVFTIIAVVVALVVGTIRGFQPENRTSRP